MEPLFNTILLIENDASLALTWSIWLKNAGFNVIHENSAEKAIEIVKTNPCAVNLVLVDIDLGPDGMDGAQAALEILENHTLPVMFLYSQTEKQLIRKTGEVPSYGYVLKDSDETLLLASVKTALRLFNAHFDRKALESAPKETENTPIESNSQLREILENTIDGVFTLNRRWQYTFLNSNAGRMMHRKSSDLLGKVIWEEFPEAVDCQFAKVYHEVMRTGKAAQIEEFYGPLNGWYEISVYPIQDGISVYYREITSKKTIEEELERQNSFFEQVFIQSATSTQILDRDGWCLRINPKLGELFGVKPEHIEGHVYNIFNDEEVKRQGIDLILEKVFNDKQTAYWEVNFDIGLASESQKIEVKEKKKVWYSNKAYPIVDQKGELRYVIIQHEDISERKFAEKALRENEELFRTTFENATTGVCLTSAEGKFIRVNRTLCSMLGYSAEELRDLRFNDITYGEDKEIGLSFLKDLISGKIENASFEKRYVCKDGQTIWAHLSIAVVRETSLKPKYFISHIQDISEHTRSKELLKESEEQFRTLFENAVLGLYRTSPDGRIVMVNQALCRMLGYSSAEELMNRNLEDAGFQPNYSRSSFKEKFRDYNNFVCIESIWDKADGSVIFVRENAIAVRDHSGNVIFYDGTVEDITKHKEAEAALIESEEKMRMIIEGMPNLFFYTQDTDGNVTYVSPSVETITGYSVDKWIGQKHWFITDSEINRGAKEKTHAHLRGEFTGETILLEVTHSGGSNILLEVFENPIMKDGKVVGLQGIAQNVTERKRAQDDLIRAKKEAEKSDKLKSEFLAQMSHEIRSPISTMLNFISLIKEVVSKPLSEEMVFSFNAIDSSSRRLIRTIDLILNMSQVQTGYLECSYQTLDLEKDVLRNIINEYSTSAIIKGVILSFSNDCDSAMINADSYTVIQIFSNLINNAIKYTKEGEINVRIYRDNESNISVDVTDTGIGISDGYISSIFTPFSQEEQGYTRKFEGNGLGLALVRKYCELNNAQISVRSKKGEGSTFTVTFCRL